MAMAWGAGISGLFSLLGGRQQAKSQKRYTDLMRELSQPGLTARKAALGYLLPRLGKESRLLGVGYKQGLEGIGRQTAGAIGRSRAMFRQNPGRGRGEELRIGLQGERAKGALSREYAGAQQQFKGGTLSELIRMSGSGDPFAMQEGQGILGQGQAQADRYGDFSSILGDTVGFYRAKQLMGMQGQNQGSLLTPNINANQGGSGMYVRPGILGEYTPEQLNRIRLT